MESALHYASQIRALDLGAFVVRVFLALALAALLWRFALDAFDLGIAEAFHRIGPNRAYFVVAVVMLPAMERLVAGALDAEGFALMLGTSAAFVTGAKIGTAAKERAVHPPHKEVRVKDGPTEIEM